MDGLLTPQAILSAAAARPPSPQPHPPKGAVPNKAPPISLPPNPPLSSNEAVFKPPPTATATTVSFHGPVSTAVPAEPAPAIEPDPLHPPSVLLLSPPPHHLLKSPFFPTSTLPFFLRIPKNPHQFQYKHLPCCYHGTGFPGDHEEGGPKAHTARGCETFRETGSFTTTPICGHSLPCLTGPAPNPALALPTLDSLLCTPLPHAPAPTEAAIKAMSVADLKQMLTSHGLSTANIIDKSDLISQCRNLPPSLPYTPNESPYGGSTFPYQPLLHTFFRVYFGPQWRDGIGSTMGFKKEMDYGVAYGVFRTAVQGVEEGVRGGRGASNAASSAGSAATTSATADNTPSLILTLPTRLLAFLLKLILTEAAFFLESSPQVYKDRVRRLSESDVFMAGFVVGDLYFNRSDKERVMTELGLPAVLEDLDLAMFLDSIAGVATAGLPDGDDEFTEQPLFDWSDPNEIELLRDQIMSEPCGSVFTHDDVSPDGTGYDGKKVARPDAFTNKKAIFRGRKGGIMAMRNDDSNNPGSVVKRKKKRSTARGSAGDGDGDQSTDEEAIDDIYAAVASNPHQRPSLIPDSPPAPNSSMEGWVKFTAMLTLVSQMTEASTSYAYNWLVYGAPSDGPVQRFRDDCVSKATGANMSVTCFLRQSYGLSLQSPVWDHFALYFFNRDKMHAPTAAALVKNLRYKLGVMGTINKDHAKDLMLPVSRIQNAVEDCFQIFKTFTQITQTKNYRKYANEDKYHMSVIDAADGYALHESKRIWEAQLVYDEPFRYYEPSTALTASSPSKLYLTEQQISYVRFLNAMSIFALHATPVVRVMMVTLHPDPTSPIPNLESWLYHSLPTTDNKPDLRTLKLFKNSDVWDPCELLRVIFASKTVTDTFPACHPLSTDEGREKLEKTIIECRKSGGMPGSVSSPLVVNEVVSHLAAVAMFALTPVVRKAGTRLHALLKTVATGTPSNTDMKEIALDHQSMEAYHLHPTFQASAHASKHFSGRKWCFEKVAEGLVGDHVATVAYAPPGFGKSGLVGQIVGGRALADTIHVAAVHVCCSQESLTCTGHALMKSIMEGYAGRRLQDLNLELENECNKVRLLCPGGSIMNPVMSARELCKKLCKVKPIKRGDKLITIVIDGIDEGDETLHNTLRELLKGMQKMSRWLRILCTSRNGCGRVEELGMRGVDLHPLGSQIDCDALHDAGNAVSFPHPDAEADVHELLEKCLRTSEGFVKLLPDASHRDKMLERIAEHSEGSMLYAATVLDLLDNGRYQDILMGEKSIFMGPKGSVMLLAFDFFFKEYVSMDDFENVVAPFFEIACATYNSLTDDMFFAVLKGSDATFTAEVYQKCVTATTCWVDSSNKKVRLYHGELGNWVRKYKGVSVKRGHMKLVTCGVKVYEQFMDSENRVEFSAYSGVFHYAAATAGGVGGEWDGKGSLPGLEEDMTNFLKNEVCAEGGFVISNFICFKLFVRHPGLEMKGALELLLKMGLSVNSRDSSMGMSLIVFPTLREGRGGEEAVKFLLEVDVEGDEIELNVVNNEEFAVTALYNCANVGSWRCMELLLGHANTDPNKGDDEGMTPLHIACVNDHEECVKLLLKDSRLDVNRRNFKGETALYVAAQFGQADIVRLLLADSRIDARCKNGDDECTAFHAAAYQCEWKVVEVLMEDGRLGVGAVNKVGIPPMLAASLVCNDFEGKTRCLALFLKHGGVSKADVEEGIERMSSMRGHAPFRKSIDVSVGMLQLRAMGKPFCCEVCGETKESLGKSLLACSVCAKVCYCSKEHQVQDWKAHKGGCKKEDVGGGKEKAKEKGGKKKSKKK